jgi:hypothetical protein
MHDIEWALFPEFPHPSIIEDLVLIPTPADLPRWLELYDADDQTSNRKTSYSTTPKKVCHQSAPKLFRLCGYSSPDSLNQLLSSLPCLGFTALILLSQLYSLPFKALILFLFFKSANRQLEYNFSI